jgi:hypothetical protein
MIRLVTLSFFILFLFGNCAKQNKEMKVTYTVRETSASTPQFTISYISDKSGTSSSVNSSAENWSSAILILEKGEFVSITVDCTAPNFDFVIDIFADGALWKESEMHNPTSTITVSGTLGN